MRFDYRRFKMINACDPISVARRATLTGFEPTFGDFAMLRDFSAKLRQSARNGSFHHTPNAEFMADLVQIARGSSLVLHHRGATNHF
jgi:hypothetical protein